MAIRALAMRCVILCGNIDLYQQASTSEPGSHDRSSRREWKSQVPGRVQSDLCPALSCEGLVAASSGKKFLEYSRMDSASEMRHANNFLAKYCFRGLIILSTYFRCLSYMHTIHYGILNMKFLPIHCTPACNVGATYGVNQLQPNF